jgi:hypothetical protein
VERGAKSKFKTCLSQGRRERREDLKPKSSNLKQQTTNLKLQTSNLFFTAEDAENALRQAQSRQREAEYGDRRRHVPLIPEGLSPRRTPAVAHCSELWLASSLSTIALREGGRTQRKATNWGVADRHEILENLSLAGTQGTQRKAKNQHGRPIGRLFCT